MPEVNLESGWEKHLRDIRSMLMISGELILHSELDPKIIALGLQEVWRKVREEHE